MQRDKTVHDRIREALLSCRVCDLQPVCLPWDMEPEERRLLDHIVEHPQPLQQGEYLFRAGDPLRGIYAVRSGMFKSQQADTGDREQVLGFILPGELAGVDGVYSQQHGSDAVALMESAVCLFPYEQLTGLLGRSERLRDQILRLASSGMDGRHRVFGRDGSSAARVANLLLDLSDRNQAHGGSASRFPFPLAEHDIAAYLKLAPAEVSRIFGQFHDKGLIALVKSELQLRDGESLAQIAASR
jgi:CRP/FNR family transcriptional regulator